jgi:hypothetical protein
MELLDSTPQFRCPHCSADHNNHLRHPDPEDQSVWHSDSDEEDMVDDSHDEEYFVGPYRGERRTWSVVCGCDVRGARASLLTLFQRSIGLVFASAVSFGGSCVRRCRLGVCRGRGTVDVGFI